MTTTGLKVALKEWGVVCRALAEGRQAVLLRKGGIAEPGGQFRVEHERFWLWPTFAHQQEAGVVESARPLLGAARAGRPAEGEVLLSHQAKVPVVYHTEDLEKALALEGLHVWSQDAVRSRFAYRRPGLFVIPVRVYQAPAAHTVKETPEQAGCKSWVELAEGLPAGGGDAVLGDAAFAEVLEALERALGAGVG